MKEAIFAFILIAALIFPAIKGARKVVTTKN